MCIYSSRLVPSDSPIWCYITSSASARKLNVQVYMNMENHLFYPYVFVDAELHTFLVFNRSARLAMEKKGKDHLN